MFREKNIHIHPPRTFLLDILLYRNFNVHKDFIKRMKL